MVEVQARHVALQDRAAALQGPAAERDHAADDDRSVVAVVCIPTFKRPAMLERTLSSLVRQTTDKVFRVIVADNDALGRQGLAAAQAMFASGQLRGGGIVEPAQGNCNAINAAMTAAKRLYPSASYLMMIDDDEVAAPVWIERMVETAERERADIVGGPVYPRFEDDPKPSIVAHPVFWPAFRRSGRVSMIYGSGNFLVRQSALARLQDPLFDGAFNYLGGGDTDFFTRCRIAGLRFHWDEEAVIHETVPASRATTRWIVKRSLRIGAINYRIDKRNAGSIVGRAGVLAKNLALLPLGTLRAMRVLSRTASPLLASHPLLIAIGRLLASLGLEPEQYRAKTP